MNYPIITLSNGLRVGNFSSPHSFTFTDGSILPACDDDQALIGTLITHEVHSSSIDPRTKKNKLFNDINISFELSDHVIGLIDIWDVKYERDEVDVVIVPLPVMQALYSKYSLKDIKDSPFRTIRVADRL